MSHSDLRSAGTRNASRIPDVSPRLSGTRGGNELGAVLAAAGLDDPALALLVITSANGIALADSARERAVYLVPPASSVATPSHPEAVRLPMPDAAFDVVLGHRLVRPGFDATPWLREAVRVLRLDGSFVLVTDPKDFQSAPLPPAGPAHLAHRALAAAGLQSARFMQHGTQSIAVMRRRDAVGGSGR